MIWLILAVIVGVLVVAFGFYCAITPPKHKDTIEKTDKITSGVVIFMGLVIILLPTYKMGFENNKGTPISEFDLKNGKVYVTILTISDPEQEERWITVIKDRNGERRFCDFGHKPPTVFQKIQDSENPFALFPPVITSATSSP